MLFLHKFLFYLVCFTVCVNEANRKGTGRKKRDVLLKPFKSEWSQSKGLKVPEQRSPTRWNEVSQSKGFRASGQRSPTNWDAVVQGGSQFIISRDSSRGYCPVRCQRFVGQKLHSNSQLMYLKCPIKNIVRKRDIFYNKQNIAHVQNMFSQFRNTNAKWPSDTQCEMHPLEKQLTQNIYGTLHELSTEECATSPRKRKRNKSIFEGKDSIIVECSNTPGMSSTTRLLDLRRGVRR